MSLILNSTTATDVYLNGVKCTEAYLNGTSVYKAITYATARVDETYSTATDYLTPSSFTVLAGTVYDGSSSAKIATQVYVSSSSNVQLGNDYGIYGGSTNSSSYYNPFVRMVIGKRYSIKYKFNLYSIGANTSDGYVSNVINVSGLTLNSTNFYIDGVLKGTAYTHITHSFDGTLVEFVMDATVTSDTSNSFYMTAGVQRSGAGYVALEARNMTISIEEI